MVSVCVRVDEADRTDGAGLAGIDLVQWRHGPGPGACGVPPREGSHPRPAGVIGRPGRGRPASERARIFESRPPRRTRLPHLPQRVPQPRPCVSRLPRLCVASGRDVGGTALAHDVPSVRARAGPLCGLRTPPRGLLHDSRDRWLGYFVALSTSLDSVRASGGGLGHGPRGRLCGPLDAPCASLGRARGFERLC
jgi:hypothetical protein